MSQPHFHVGLDIGSTTVKAVVLDDAEAIVFSEYTRHNSAVRPCATGILEKIADFVDSAPASMSITGSGGLSLAGELGLPLIQEVLASNLAIRKEIPDADVIIELGGEDAKITFLTGGLEQRMNETCAGGTGAFIDQMGAFIGTDAAGLNALALRYGTIYPIASRCGVFAKTDILPLLNEGCAREDIAASIMQAVVNQTISGLAHGRAIRGKVVFLGGPLFFLSFLRERFQATLKEMREAVFPDSGQYFVALGAAYYAKNGASGPLNLEHCLTRLKHAAPGGGTGRLAPLFVTGEEREAFTARHAKSAVVRRPLSEASGRAWLGFDSGSTTIKAVLLDDEGHLLYSFYDANRGDPLKAALDILEEIYRRMPAGLSIGGAAATGYGSALLTAALHLDVDEVETVAHFTAARFFEPEVSFVLDIGGQDIKCMHVKGGFIDRISLNEACSAGCGSFIENFAESLHIPLQDFVEAALAAPAPVDLGTRCTVFMNSKVKQAQKDGAELGDIAAGLSYAVVRNACFKVIKLTSTAEMGEHVVAQGGAFANDALLRALELELGRPVLRPAISGLMGAFGVALVARARAAEWGRSAVLGPEELAAFSMRTNVARCHRCTNACLLTVTTFADRRRFVSGNRCERGAGVAKVASPNLYAYKAQRLFEPYTPLEGAPRGPIGIPRALNMFEDYPLWFTLLTRLGYQVLLSSPSSRDIYYKGYDTIPSQTVCYPAKLSHGHVLDLIERGVKAIFFPCLPREQKNPDSAAGTFNCPVVAGYPELLQRNIGQLEEQGVTFVCPFLPLDRKMLARRLHGIDFFSKIPLAELEAAVAAGFAALDAFHADMRAAGEAVLRQLDEQGKMGVVLAGHPYHIDPEVHHGVAELVASCGLAVLTEDSVAHLMPDPGPLRVVDQWAYHSRLYRAGAYAASVDNLAVLQLLSFGCGLDAITSDQLEEILTRNGRLYSQIKVDEGTNLGPARIRVRSLLAAMRERHHKHPACAPGSLPDMGLPAFTQEMRKTHTLLIPQMSPLHFQFTEALFAAEGYRAVQLPHVDRAAIDLGLRYVNNDACFPAIVVIGQLLQAVQSGRYDPNRVALVITQTGGGCRATNYLGFLRRALVHAGLGQVPVVPLAMGTRGPGLRMSGSMLRRFIMAGHYGDALARMIYRVRPYEREPGATDRLAAKWAKRASANILSGNFLRFELNMVRMIREFDRLPLRETPRRPRVGLVGEILLKYHPDANNNAAGIVEAEGGEVVSTDIMDFIFYCFYDNIFDYRHLAGQRKDSLEALASIAFLELTRMGLRLAFALSTRFSAPLSFKQLRSKTRDLISHGHQSGEGWLLAAEMVRMLESGIRNILCMQPFGCLPNHIVGKGLIRELKRRYPDATITALDYDPGTSETNQINRIKLMMRSGQLR